MKQQRRKNIPQLSVPIDGELKRRLEQIARDADLTLAQLMRRAAVRLVNEAGQASPSGQVVAQ